MKRVIVYVLVIGALALALLPGCSYYDTEEEKADKALLSSHKWAYDTIAMRLLIDSVFYAHMFLKPEDTVGMNARIKNLQVFMVHMDKFAIEFRPDGIFWVKGSGAKEGATGQWTLDGKTIQTELTGANDIKIKAEMTIQSLDSGKFVAINKALEKDLGLTTFVMRPAN
ncbi:hypothetical protein [Rhodoflexus caldus]|uniref:hypothetical protein n=1 Tax=Rhodoflexus caldus TaxID=2891236 RepID=UPI002029C2E1|nr:hypothetical protein [Rhodoflexus caldus]